MERGGGGGCDSWVPPVTSHHPLCLPRPSVNLGISDPVPARPTHHLSTWSLKHVEPLHKNCLLVSRVSGTRYIAWCCQSTSLISISARIRSRL